MPAAPMFAPCRTLSRFSLQPAIASATGFLGLPVGASHPGVDDLIPVCMRLSDRMTGVAVFAPLLLNRPGNRPSSPLPGRCSDALVLLVGPRFGAQDTALLALGLPGMGVMAAQFKQRRGPARCFRPGSHSRPFISATSPRGWHSPPGRPSGRRAE